MLNAADPELLSAAKEPDIASLPQTFKQPQAALGEFLKKASRPVGAPVRPGAWCVVGIFRSYD